jgi:peptidylprolyl isomerase
MKHTLTLVVLLTLTVAVFGQGQANVTTTKSGLKYIDQTVGTGTAAAKGSTVQVHYTGWLYVNGKRGAKFDSSVDRGTPFEFKLGDRKVIAGWEEGVEGMKIGGKRQLIIPPDLAYGAREVGGVIPANSTLDFEVELLKVSK